MMTNTAQAGPEIGSTAAVQVIFWTFNGQRMLLLPNNLEFTSSVRNLLVYNAQKLRNFWFFLVVFWQSVSDGARYPKASKTNPQGENEARATYKLYRINNTG